MHELVEDVELSFKLLEFSIRTMCYAELGEFDLEIFGRDLNVNLDEGNLVYPQGDFFVQTEVKKVSQMAVGAAFGATAICLDRLLEKLDTATTEMASLKSLVAGVRNAFSHGISAPHWYVKPHKFERIDLNFLHGPLVDLEKLNGMAFDYAQVGGLLLWCRIKDCIISAARKP